MLKKLKHYLLLTILKKNNLKMPKILNNKGKQILTLILLGTYCICFGQTEDDNPCASSKTKLLQNYFNKNARKQNKQKPQQNININYYHINLNITFETKNINGSCTIKSTNLNNNEDSIYFDLSNSLHVDSVLLNNKKVNFIHSNNLVQIILKDSLQKNELFITTIYYQGTPVKSSFGSFEFVERNNKKDKSIWTLSQPFGASDWFPCKNQLEDKADSSDVWITADKYFVSVSNGILTEVIDNKNNTNTYKWKNRYPIAQYLISIAMSNYTLHERQFKYENFSMPITDYVYPETFNEKTKEQLSLTEKALQIFSEKFGTYPFIKEKYGHAQFGWGGGMEHQTCSSMGDFSWTLVAHELAHQWFGDKITCKNWENIWLNEGFATYSESLLLEELYGKRTYNSQISNESSKAKRANGTIYIQNPISVYEIFDSNKTYSKGALVLHMLRGIVGKEVFYDIIKTYINDKNLAYGNATTEDFQKIAESVSGKDLNYFFEEWIYNTGFPHYILKWTTDTLQNGNLNAKLKIDQLIKPNTFDYFKMPIQLLFINKTTKDSTIKTIWNNERNQVFEFTIKDTTEIIFDPNNLILKEIVYSNFTFEPKKILPLDSVNNYNHFTINISPNPIEANNLKKINLTIGIDESSLVNCSLFNSNGQFLQQIINKQLTKGKHLLSAYLRKNITSGKYIILSKTKDKTISTTLIVK